MRTFQRQITTCAFKVAGGVDLAPSAMTPSRSTKQHPIAPEFTGKITKAFLDALYAVLDGLVHLASDESSAASVKQTVPQTITVTGANPLALLDLENAVRDYLKTFFGHLFGVRLSPFVSLLSCLFLSFLLTFLPPLPSCRRGNDLHTAQEIRLLLVVSNFGHLRNVLIPSMIGEFEGAFGTNIEADKQVRTFLSLE